jgi:hypothetical protein
MDQMFTPVFISPTAGLEWGEVGPAQAKETSEEDMVRYRKTVSNAHAQWGLTAQQEERLGECLEVLEDTSPLPFHWVEEKLLLTEGLTWDLESSKSDDSDLEGSDGQELKTETRTNVWAPQDVAEMEKTPLEPFQLLDLVVLNSGMPADSDTPFYLARIVSIDNPPPWGDVDGATADDRLVQVHWYKKNPKIDWHRAKYTAMHDSRGDPVLEWTMVSTFYFTLEKGLTDIGSKIRKQNPNDQKIIEFYLEHPELEQQNRSPSGSN